MKKAKHHRKNYFLLLLAVILIIGGAYLVTTTMPSAQDNSDIISQASQQQDVAAFLNNTNYTVSVKQLTYEDLQTLRVLLPSVYLGVPPGVYQITYQESQGKAIALYDNTLKKVVKFYTE